jgi:sulfotransferase family protein
VQKQGTAQAPERLRASEKMQNKVSRPIFVVGSPRSGTSILTWCLGQHPNIFAVPESNWMGDFVVNAAVVHEVGAARGHLSILSAMDISRDELLANFGRTINDLILSHRLDLERTRAAIPSLPEFMRRSLPGAKTRWVDGTPEYSLHIYALKKLFPDAVFIHVLRDVRDVVRSMLNIHRLAGVRLVANEEEAYRYWLRTVKACLQAERAYGSNVVCRLPYNALIDHPESAIRSMLDFVGEPFWARCLEPLSCQINSSDVPPDFVAEAPATDPRIVEEATNLYAELQNVPELTESSSAAADEMEAAFDRRVQHLATVEDQLRNAVQTIKTLEKQCPKENIRDEALL